MIALRNFLFKRKTAGIGLLELMLSLAIIAILLIMATRFYTTTARSQKVNETVTLIGNIKTAAYGYYESKRKLTDFPTDAYRYIADEYVSGTTVKDPWGNDLTISSPAEQKASLTINAPNKGSADLLRLRLSCDESKCGSGSTVTYEFDVSGSS